MLNGRIVNKSYRYVFLGQFFNTAGSETEAVIAVKSFPCGTSVTSEVLFKTITTEACEGFLTKIFSLMADTTAVNTGKISRVNKRLRDYFVQEVGHDIHTLECLFHFNEIYFTHVVSLVEGRKKGPGMMQEGALYNKIKTIQKPDTMANFSCENLPKISVTSIAPLHLKGKIKWFADQKSSGNSKRNFRTDQLCMLVLACFTFMDVPNSLKSLLFYKQETMYHSRWITTANGYLRLFLFPSHRLSVEDVTKLTKLV